MHDVLNGTATIATSAIDSLLDRSWGYRDEGTSQPGSPTLGRAILICMDTRIDPSAISRLRLGEAHVVRCAGALLGDEVIESIAISQEKTGSREVMVVHHTGCAGLGVHKPGMTPEETVAECSSSETTPAFPRATTSAVSCSAWRTAASPRWTCRPPWPTPRVLS